MTDERYTFNETVSERSKMKRGAAHRKNGSKSKKCTMPSDHLTAKEKKKLNGECRMIKMNRPYKDWKQFKKLSESVKYSYISGLIEDYGARACDICEMFGISYQTLYDEFKRWSIPMKPFKKKRNMDERWLDFITKPEVVETVVKPKKTDAEILKERFDITVEEPATQEPVEEIKVEEEPVEETKVEEPVASEPPRVEKEQSSIEHLKEICDEATARCTDSDPYEERAVFNERFVEENARDAALYLYTFYEECKKLGFSEVLAQQLLVERSKKCVY